jgi:soluble lytic murein transglycosylase
MNPSLLAGSGEGGNRLYPIAFGAEIDAGVGARNLTPELVLAVIREESRFDEYAASPAGARGLMQLMPTTAEWIGRKIGRRRINVNDLDDPGFSIAAGCRYLRFLLDRGNGSIVAALAAYNAGHGRMKSWKSRHGPHIDPIAALELIGPMETRRYVRRVLDSMVAYDRLIGAMQLEAPED